MSISRPAVLVLAVLLSACDQIAVLDGTKAREADGVAVGSACRQAGRAIEDCFTMNPDSPKASVFNGWKEMNDYMVQNKLDTVAPQLARAEIKPKAEAESKIEVKADAKAEADDKRDQKRDEKRDVKAAAAVGAEEPKAASKPVVKEPPREAVKVIVKEEPKEAAADIVKDKDPAKERAREAAREIMREIKRENALKEPAKAGAPAPAAAAAPTQGATLVLPSTPPAATGSTGPLVAPPLPTVVKPIPQPH